MTSGLRPNAGVVLATEDAVTTHRMLAAVTLGLVDLMRSGVLTPREAYGYFFVPTMLHLEGAGGHDPRLLEMLHAGAELYDLEKHVPTEVDNALIELRAKALELARGEVEREPLLRKWIRHP